MLTSRENLPGIDVVCLFFPRSWFNFSSLLISRLERGKSASCFYLVRPGFFPRTFLQTEPGGCVYVRGCQWVLRPEKDVRPFEGKTFTLGRRASRLSNPPGLKSPGRLQRSKSRFAQLIGRCSRFKAAHWEKKNRCTYALLFLPSISTCFGLLFFLFRFVEIS